MPRHTPPVPPLAERQRPALSETLPHPREPFLCQRCGAVLDPEDASSAPAWARWQECDSWDRKTDAVVFLCMPCGDAVIDAHPRLYHRLRLWEPFPGAMPICGTCPMRRGVTCAATRTRGGPGVMVRQRNAGTVHVYYGGGRGAWLTEYAEWPTACVGADGTVYAGNADAAYVARVVTAAAKPGAFALPYLVGGPDMPRRLSSGDA